jgi:hypothetical protein
MAGLTRVLLGDKGIALLIVAGIFIVFALTAAPVSIYKPSDQLLKKYLNTPQWNLAVYPPDHSVGVSSYGYFIHAAEPEDPGKLVRELNSNLEKALSSKSLEESNLYIASAAGVLRIPASKGFPQPVIIVVFYYKSPIINGTYLYSHYVGRPGSVHTFGSAGLGAQWIADLSQRKYRVFNDLTSEYCAVGGLRSIVGILETSAKPEGSMEKASGVLGREGGLEALESNCASSPFTILFYTDNSTALENLVKQLDHIISGLEAYSPGSWGAARYVLLVKYDFSKVKLNPVSPNSVKNTVGSIASKYNAHVYPGVWNSILDYSNIVNSFQVATAVVFLIFVLGVFIVIPATSKAMTTGIRHILYLLRIRGLRHKVLRRSLLYASLIAVGAGLLMGYLGVTGIIYLWIPGYFELAVNSVILDKFTFTTVVISGVIAGLLYWRSFTRSLKLEKLEASHTGEHVERGARLAWILLALSLYHIARGFLGWSAIRELEYSSGFSMLIFVILVVLGIIELLTTLFTPVMLSYSISVLVMKYLDILVSAVSASRRFLGELANIASGVGRLVTPALVGLSTILVFSLTILHPALSLTPMVESAAFHAAEYDTGAPYVIVKSLPSSWNTSLTSIVENAARECPSCGFLIVAKTRPLPFTYIQLSSNSGRDYDISYTQTFIIAVNPSTIRNVAYGMNRANTGTGREFGEVLKDIYDNKTSILITPSQSKYSFNKAVERLSASGGAISSDICIRSEVNLSNSLCRKIRITDVSMGMPGQGLLDTGTSLLTGPWMLDFIDQWVKTRRLVNFSNTPFTVPEIGGGSGLYLVVLSDKPIKQVFPGPTLLSTSLRNITSSSEYKLWRDSVLVGLGAPSLEATGLILVGLLLLLTGLLAYVSMKNVDRIYRLLRLRGINRRMTLMTLFLPWLSIILVISLIGVFSGLGITMIYRMSMQPGGEFIGSIGGLSRSIEGVRIGIGDGYIDWASTLKPVPLEALLILIVSLIPLAYFAKIVRGSPVQSMREV